MPLRGSGGIVRSVSKWEVESAVSEVAPRVDNSGVTQSPTTKRVSVLLFGS